MFETQPGKMPTNKAMTGVGGTVGLLQLIYPAMQEAWPQIAPLWASGPNMTLLIASAISGGLALGLAWLVPDRQGIPNPEEGA